MNILHVTANPKPAAESASKELTAAFLSELKKAKPAATVTEVDLYANPPPFYTYDVYRYFWYPVFDASYQVSPREKLASAYALEQCALFKSADVLVLTSPMWNFSLPAILKAWIDQVIMPNHTFNISSSGVKGLHKVRKVVLLAASGGVYAAGDAREHLAAEVRAAFGFMGIPEVDIAWAQGQNPFFFQDHAERKAKAVGEAAALGKAMASLPL